MRILIAEDEQRARQGIRKLITSISEEYEIIAEAADGKRALDLIQAVKPEVVFTDIKMPYMDGIALIKAANSMGLQVKFVITSAYEEFETARQAISLGVTEYLVKPIIYDEVEIIMKRLESLLKNKEWIPDIDIVKKYPDAHPLVVKVLKIIGHSYAAKLNQEELAKSLSVTPEYLSYIFHKDVGERFSKFLRAYRIDVAKTLLLQEGMVKEEIPYAVGFSDPKYFHKVFREVSGETITEFLKNMKRY
jgi:Response regulator containing CheY-like receiver domain and AraC-type DNA-binding domain